MQFASASLNRATAGLVTTITARLDNFSGRPGTATVESKMTAIADRATGLEAQYTLKVSAGGAMAGVWTCRDNHRRRQRDQRLHHQADSSPSSARPRAD